MLRTAVGVLPLTALLAAACAGGDAATNTEIAATSTGNPLPSSPSPPANALLGSWKVTGYDDGAGGLVSVAAETELDARFGADGRLHGSAGCNRYSGTYRLEAGTLSIGPFATTRRACAPPIMAQEAAFLAALQSATSYRVEAPLIVLLLPDGTRAVRLSPEPVARSSGAETLPGADR